MMWNYGDGGSWFWMGGAMLLVLGGLILLGIWGIRSLSASKPGGELPLDTLRRRLASGEISPEEFTKIKKALE